MAPTDTIAAVMTKQPAVLESGSPLTHAARVMRDSDIGDVIVIEGGASAASSRIATSSFGASPRARTLPPPGSTRSAARMSRRCPRTLQWKRPCD